LKGGLGGGAAIGGGIKALSLFSRFDFSIFLIDLAFFVCFFAFSPYKIFAFF
jgi:hypothetical protein